MSVSPASGSGLSGPFTWTVSSPAGHGNLAHVFGLFNTTSDSTVNACYIHYDPGSNLLYLADNASANWLGGFVPGSSGSASNSQCSIYGSGSSFSTSGTQLSVIVSVTFQSSFSGSKNEYLFALDNAGSYTGWRQMGTWTIGETISSTNLPSGTAAPSINVSSSYTSGGATSNLGHAVEYQFDWGDGTQSVWSSATSAAHAWSTAGTRNVTVVARCATQTTVVSQASAPFTVNVGGGAPSSTRTEYIFVNGRVVAIEK